MKRSNYFLHISALLLVFSLSVLTACATAQTGDTNGGVVGAARQLAANLNAMNQGSARANGDTVTLINWIGLGRDNKNKNITVPAGVTLDMTAYTGDKGPNAQIALSSGATLTVNGTVNTRAWGIGVEGDASAATINGSGTINLLSKGELLYGIDNGRKLTLDGVKLVGLADNSHSLVQVNEGGEFVMQNGAITGNTRTGGERAESGGIRVWKGTFIMSGGEISSNIAQGSKQGRGGGVYVDGGKFIMSGGEISGNSAIGEGGEGRAGGVYVSEGTFTMSDGAISGNTAKGGDGTMGGGVWTWRVTFTMTGGTISGNTAQGIGNRLSGGGVKLEDSAFTMSGGRIQGSTDSDGFSANTTSDGNRWGSALFSEGNQYEGAGARWGTGGTYTKGGIPQTGGSNIGNTNDTLIAIP